MVLSRPITASPPSNDPPSRRHVTKRSTLSAEAGERCNKQGHCAGVTHRSASPPGLCILPQNADLGTFLLMQSSRVHQKSDAPGSISDGSNIGELYGHRSTDDGHSVDLETSSRAPLYLCMKCMKFSILQCFTVEPPVPLLLSQTQKYKRDPSLSAWVRSNGPRVATVMPCLAVLASDVSVCSSSLLHQTPEKWRSGVSSGSFVT